MSVHAAGLAAREFRHVRVLLLRHDGRTGAEPVRQIDEADARAHPQHEFLGKARDVRHDERGRRREFDREVAVGHRIERIGADAVEAERGRHRVTVDGIAGARERRRAERQPVHATAAVAHALGIAREHLDVGEQVMPERHRLRHLQMREAGHDGVRVLLRHVDEREAQVLQQVADAIDLAAQPQADIGRDLIVARAARVQPFARIADQRGEPRLDVQVHVFEIQLPFELAALDLALDLRHAALDGREVVGADDFLRREHRRMRERALNVDEREPLVEEHRRRIAFDEPDIGSEKRADQASPFVKLGRHGVFSAFEASERREF